MVASNTMNIAKRFTSIFAVVAVSASLGAAVPAASAGSAMADTTVTATRSLSRRPPRPSVIFSPSTHPRMLSPTPIGWHRSWTVPRPSLRQKKDRKAQEQAEAEAQAQAQALRLRHRRRLKLRLPAVLPNVPTSAAFPRLLRVPLVRHWPTMLCSSKAIRMCLEAILRPAGIALVSCSGCSPSSV